MSVGFTDRRPPADAGAALDPAQRMSVKQPSSSPPADSEARSELPADPTPRGAAPHGSVVIAIETTQTVLTALILAFIFRAFFIEAFVIPTGSMADALLGRHLSARCPFCGWAYDVGPRLDGRESDDIAPDFVRCPNCRQIAEPPADSAKPGDRILVAKWPFMLGWPRPLQRWDVIVFRDPLDPTANYIKRLIGLPGESVEIIDGDVYINGAIAQKTPAAQSALWFLVFDQDHVPTLAGSDDPMQVWVTSPQEGAPGAGWTGLQSRVLRYDAVDDVPRRISFAPAAALTHFLDSYGYNPNEGRVYVSDVRLTCELTPLRTGGSMRLILERDGLEISATLSGDGSATLTQANAGAPTALGTWTGAGGSLRAGERVRVEFACVDRVAYLAIDGRRVAAAALLDAPDLGSIGRRRVRTMPPRISVESRGLPLELRHVRVDRDVYYRSDERSTLRAGPGEPFTLREREHFVLGDNSPASHDSREWSRVGPHLRADYERGTYRLGVVRADQIVGTAFYVYLPGLLPVDVLGWTWHVPDLGRVRFIR